jgi:RNA polymerase sigma factor (sigma-70 family)
MAEQVSDAILIERFVNDREESAFVALVRRHGPLVEGTCRRVLRNEHDVEDVFQATFLVLARKAAAMVWQDSVGGWLCAVAHRLALSARSDASRLRGRETSITALTRGSEDHGVRDLPEEFHPSTDSAGEVERRDLRRVLDDELLLLPEKYRAPVVLCYLEGRTHEEAALHLGWPAGSISRRLERARALLRRRLTERGVSLVIGLFGLALCLYGAGMVNRRDDRASISVRQAMSHFRPFLNTGPGIYRPLAREFGVEGSPDPKSLLSFARLAGLVAAQVEEQDPGRKREDWRKYAAEMRNAASELRLDVEQGDRSAMLASVFRLEGSCHKCHEVFR